MGGPKHFKIIFDHFSRHFRKFGTNLYFFISDPIFWPPVIFFHFFFLGGGLWLFLSLKKLFICIIIMLYTEFQSPTMPGTGQKVCVGAVGWVGVSLF